MYQGVPWEPVGLHNGVREIVRLVARAFRTSVIRLPRRHGSTTTGPPPGATIPGPETVPDGPALDDAALVERSRIDPEAFGILYDRYCDQIFGYVYRRLRDHEVAEDVTAEVFVKALRALHTYRPAVAPFPAWLHGIAGNAVIDHVRLRRPTTSLDAAAEHVDEATPVDEQAITRVEVAQVWAAVDALSQAQRTAVTLRFGRDLPIADIAARMGRTEGAVKLLLNRGLTAVRGRLREEKS